MSESMRATRSSTPYSLTTNATGDLSASHWGITPSETLATLLRLGVSSSMRPDIDPDGDLTPREELELFRYYSRPHDTERPIGMTDSIGMMIMMITRSGLDA
jgi:hypothetical protein